MKKILLFTTAMLALVACDKNDDNPNPTSGAAIITATIGESTVTRASDTDWAKGDEIGITSTVGSTVGPYVNLKYTTEGDGNFSGTDLYFYNSMTLTAYYPFYGDEGTVPGENGIIEGNTGPENQALDRQSKIDFLWDRKTGVNKEDFSATNPNVNFTFAHKMSKVTFTFQSSYEELKLPSGEIVHYIVDVKDIVSYKIDNLVLHGTFNTADGVCSVDKDATGEGLSIEVGKGNVEDNKSVQPVIIFPQLLKGGSTTLEIYTDEIEGETLQHYKCSLSFSNGEIKPGCHYKYTIKVTKLGLIVGDMTVEPWSEESRFIVATVDGNIFEENG